MNGSVYTLKAEFGQARDLAVEAGVPFRGVLRVSEERAWEQVRSGQYG